MKYICQKFINHQIKKCLLFRCHHAVVIIQTLNWTNQCPLFMTPYFWDQWGWPPTEPLTVTHARAHWRTLDLANAFVSPGVNSRGELVPSHGASRRRLEDYCSLNSDNFSIYSHINFVFKTARKLKNLHKHFMVWRKFCCLHAGC
jgi:hypothetical protein